MLGPRRRGVSAARRGDGVRLDAVAALERDDSTNVAMRAVQTRVQTASALTTPQHIDDDRKEVICVNPARTSPLVRLGLDDVRRVLVGRRVLAHGLLADHDVY